MKSLCTLIKHLLQNYQYVCRSSRYTKQLGGVHFKFYSNFLVGTKLNIFKADRSLNIKCTLNKHIFLIHQQPTELAFKATKLNLINTQITKNKFRQQPHQSERVDIQSLNPSQASNKIIFFLLFSLESKSQEGLLKRKDFSICKIFP